MVVSQYKTKNSRSYGIVNVVDRHLKYSTLINYKYIHIAI